MIIKQTTTKIATKDMMKQFRKLTFSHGPSGLRDRLNCKRNDKIWYIEEGGRIVGWCLIYIQKSSEDFLWSGYYVNMKYRHKGYGRALFAKVLEYAEKRSIRMEVYPSNNSARHLFEKASENAKIEISIIS